MTAAPSLLLWLLLLGLPWLVPGQPDQSPGLRFSDLKVCADEECSKVQPLQQEEEPGLLDQLVTSVQPPEEPRLLDQAVTGHMSASEVSQKPNIEKEIDPDFLETKVSPAGAGDAEKHLEIRAEEPAHVQLLENTLDFLNAFILCSSKMLIATLPHNFQSGPDFYGIPWQPVIATVVLGIVSFTIFFWRTILVVKSRVYKVSLKHISERVEELKKDNIELTQKLSNYEQKIKESRKCVQEIEKQNVILSDDTISYKDKIKVLEESIEILSEKAKSIHLILQSEGDGNIENQGVVCTSAPGFSYNSSSRTTKLSQEEYERQDREQRVSAADEVKTYKRRIEELEEQLQKAQSLKSQIIALEKKGHENWLKGCAAERAMEERKIEAANLRNKLLEISQKMAMRQDEPVIIKPIPGRPNTQNPPQRGSLDRDLPSPRWSSEAPGKYTASDPGTAPVVNSTSRSSSPTKATDKVKQTASQEPGSPLGSSMAPLAEHPVAANVAPEGPPPYPGAHLLGAPLGGPMPPPIRYGPPPQLYGQLPPLPFGMYPPLEYAPDVLPGRWDLPVDPREFFPGHIPFRPPGSLGPREYFIPGARLPPLTHGPQDYPPTPPAARDLLPCGPREEAPHASRSSVQV